MSEDEEATRLTRLRLDRMPLPSLGESDDKEDRGTVLAIGGSATVPGAIMLAGLGALRAGAGKLQIATAKLAAMSVAVAIPEALVVGIPTTRDGELSEIGMQNLATNIHGARAIVFGPGMSRRAQTIDLLRYIVDGVDPATTLVLDGAGIGALNVDEDLLKAAGRNTILTPHAGEMASLLEIPREEVQANGSAVAEHTARRFGAVVVLKGSTTFIAAPDGRMLQYRDGKAGLGTSGSGDVLAGVIAGLAARGADPITAAAWGVWAHGSAGNKLSRSVGSVGFLASELLPVIPALLEA